MTLFLNLNVSEIFDNVSHSRLFHNIKKEEYQVNC